MESHPSVRQMIRTTRIIVIALVLGVSFFAGFVVMHHPQQQQNNQQPIMTLTAIAFVIIDVVVSTIIPRIIVRSNIKAIAQGRWPMSAQQQYTRNQYLAEMLASDEAKLALIYQQMTIIRGALFEGAAFFTWFVYWQEGQFVALALGIGLIILLVTCFPITSRVERWMEDRLRELREMRM